MATKPSIHKDGDLSSTLAIVATTTTVQAEGFDLINQDSTLLDLQIVMSLTAVTGGDGLTFNLVGSANSDLSSETVIDTKATITTTGLKYFAVPYDFSFRYIGIQCVAAAGETGTVSELFLNVPLEG